MTWHVYLLRCADGGVYCSMTGDLRCRLRAHSTGRVMTTRSRRPLRLVWFHVYPTAAQARRREKSLKNGRTRKKTIDLMIRQFPQYALAAFAAEARQG